MHKPPVRINKDYFAGIDLGTSSAAIVCTDENYKIMKVNGKYVNSVLTFKECETAKKRTMQRTHRKLQDREDFRLYVLNDILGFRKEISKIDPQFFDRRENSKYFLEDKDVDTKNVLFDDEDYDDSAYYHDYPTISHLIMELINNPNPHDIRLIYLVIVDALKHACSFLYDSLSVNDDWNRFNDIYKEFLYTISETLHISFPTNIDISKVQDILGDKRIGKNEKSKILVELYGFTSKKNPIECQLINALCGKKVNVNKIFTDVVVADGDDIPSICVSEVIDEDQMEYLDNCIGNDNFNIFILIESLYNMSSLYAIMGDCNYLAEAKIKMYNKYKEDLKLLKKVIKNYYGKEFYNGYFDNNYDKTAENKIFSDSYPSYAAYNNGYIENGKNVRRGMNSSARTRNEFYKKLKELLSPFVGDKDVDYILEEMDNDLFLIKQRTTLNSIIPNQLVASQVRTVLNNSEKYIPFLAQKVDEKHTMSDRVIDLITYRKPHIMGTIGVGNKNGWAIRLEDGTILPWNAEFKVDLKRAASDFITRMVKTCAYDNELVLPKCSLLYERFSILNSINCLCINGRRIDVSLKQDIYNDLFKSEQNVTKARLVDYMMKRGLITDKTQLSGFDETMDKTLSTYKKFYKLVGDKLEESFYQSMAEDIVFWSTVYGKSNKRFYEQQIREHYGDVLTEEQIKRAVRFNFTGWGQLSKQFLNLCAVCKDTNEETTLIDALWNTNMNLMELIYSHHYSFRDIIDTLKHHETKGLFDFTYEDLDGYYFSPAVKRSIWQAILMLQDCVKAIGYEPTKLFIEMARDTSLQKNGKSGKGKVKVENTDNASRKDRLLGMYGKIKKVWKDSGRNWEEEIKHAAEKGWLAKNIVYLYFLQMGKSMYTGDEIDIKDLLVTNSKYDTDHIYAKSISGDNNLANNLVLCEKRENGEKRTDLVNPKIIAEMTPFWKELLEYGFMNEEKFNRLTRTEPFTIDERIHFIERQLVATRQSTKGLMQILSQILPNTRIIPVSAGLVSDFRHQFDLLKTRTVNDFHHAHDAYLNIVVGNIYDTKFTSNPINFIKDEFVKNPQKYHYNLEKMYDWDIARKGKVAWKAPNKQKRGGTIEIVRSQIGNCHVNTIRLSRVESGRLMRDTIYNAKAVSKSCSYYLPLKTTDPKLYNTSRYGGYAYFATAYFFLVEHGDEDKRQTTLETVPIYLRETIESEPNGLIKYAKETLGLINPLIIKPKLRSGTMIEVDGYRVIITGKSGNVITVRNATSLFLQQDWLNYVHRLEKAVLGKIKNLKIVSAEKNKEFYQLILDKHLHSIFSKRPKSIANDLLRLQDKFNNLDLEAQCNTLLQILRLTAPVPGASADLTMLGLAKSAGYMSLDKNIHKNGKEIYIIHQSRAGLREWKEAI